MDVIRANSQTPKEERANTATALLGVICSLAALVLLISKTADTGQALKTFTACLYGGSLLLVFSASAIYHALDESVAKHVFKAVDHAAIFLLIAATYTPFALLVLQGSLGTMLLMVVWSLAGMGIAIKIMGLGKITRAEFTLYLALGWSALFFAEPILAVSPPELTSLLLLGGAFFMVGIGLYFVKKLPYNHALWHICVIAGCITHFKAVYQYALS